MGAKPPKSADPRGWGGCPLATYIRRCEGQGWRTPVLPKPPPPCRTTSSSPPSPQTLGEALSDLHHVHHTTVVVLLISRALIRTKRIYNF